MAVAEENNPFLAAGIDISDERFDAWAASNVIPLDDHREKVMAPIPACETLNDAEILGTEPEGLGDFLERDATFLIGELWGQRDRRNTQDKDWNSVPLSWGAWIGGQDGDKNAEGSTGKARNAPAWGFSRHPVGKNKEGAAIVLGSSVGGARKAKAMDEMFAMGLDVDSGASLDDTLTTVEGLGLLCFVYTSFNHGKKGIELKRDEVLRKLDLKRDPTDEEIRQFLREHDKHRYEETFIDAVTVAKQKEQTTEGVKIILDTPPLEKFRLIFPLAEPVKLIDLADTQQASLDLWENKITGLARNTLGVHFDTSCTDPSRLFYTARHPKNADDWYAAIIQGDPLAFDDISPMKKAAYVGGKDANAFTQAGGETAGERPPQCYAPSGASLNKWHRSAKDRFMLADLLEAHCSDKVRHAGGEAQGHVHTECPFEHEHTSEGGTATMAINCIDSQNEYWTWFCHHDACQGRHKLEFLEEALRQGWFEEDALTTEGGYLLEPEDGDNDPLEPEEAKKERARTFEERAEQFQYEADASDVETFIGEAHAAGIEDAAMRERICKAVTEKTALRVQEVRDMWTKFDRKARADARKQLTEARRNSPKAPFVPLEEATAETVERAAKAAAWLPPFVTYKNGWFYAPDFDKPDSPPMRLCRAFEVPYVAFGETEEGRTNEITIRYRHRSAQRGIVESVYSIGDAFRDSGSLISRLADDGLEIDAMAKTPVMVALL